MTYDEFTKLSEINRVKAMRKAIKAAAANSKQAISNRDVLILKHSLQWLGANRIIQTWEKRIIKLDILLHPLGQQN